MTSYNELIEALAKAYPDFEITMGTTNTLRAPAIIVQQESIDTDYADDSIYGVTSATYNILYYVETTAEFNPWPAAHLFGNLSQINFDRLVDGEAFQSTVTIKGPHCLWNKVNTNG